ncbi:hypothetical protein V6N13_009385 [Hibiscus sabdariffa]
MMEMMFFLSLLMVDIRRVWVDDVDQIQFCSGKWQLKRIGLNVGQEQTPFVYNFRFEKQEDASKAIERVNEFVLYGAKLSVLMEKYTGGRPKWNQKIHGDNGKGEEEISRKLSLVRNTCRIVEGSNGRTKEAVQRLGGKLYLLSFEDDELFIILEDLNWSYLKEIFSKVVPWSEDIMGLARVTWLGCWAFRFTVGITLQSKELQNYRALLKHSGDLDDQGIGSKSPRRSWADVVQRNLELRPIDYDGMLTTRARELSVMGLLNQVGLSCGSTVELAVKASDDAKYNKGLSILAPTQVILSLDKCIDVRDEPRVVLSKFVEGRNKIKEKGYGSLREILNKGLTEFEIRKRDLASCRVKKDKKLLESSELSGRSLFDSNLANMRDLLKGSKVDIRRVWVDDVDQIQFCSGKWQLKRIGLNVGQEQTPFVYNFRSNPSCALLGGE